MDVTSSSLLCVFLAGIGLYFAKHLESKSSYPLPPGPKPLPLLGNLRDMPSKRVWLTYAAWGKQYGEISSVSVLGNRIVILNSAKAAIDVLQKHNAVTSNRPYLTMARDLAGWSDTLILTQYGERFNQFRKMFYKSFGSPSNLKAFHPIQHHATLRLVQDVLNEPGELAAHVRKATGAIILKISYGYDVQERDDPLVELADKFMMYFSDAITPGAYFVDLFPILKYLPSWLPGANFQKTALLYKQITHDLVNIPYNIVLEQIAAGTAPYSFTSSHLEGRNLSPEEHNILKWAAQAMYAGGADTIVSAIYSFFLAMMIYPDIQARAQAELDSVVGTDRLPTFDDRNSLPYINAICKEVLRWNVIVPLISHATSQDVIYNGYLIPKGSSVVANTWQILHDEETYPNPEVFDPTRFIGSNPQPDPQEACFGYGRRICPGQEFADASLFISCATSLAVLHIKKHVEDGKEVTPTLEQNDGSICHPLPFKCNIVPRSAEAEALIWAV